MLRNNRGASVVESLLAFSIWSLFALSLIPQLILLYETRSNIKEEAAAYKLLFENIALQKELNSIENQGITYHFQTMEGKPYQKKCIYWENSERKEICANTFE
ncbi:competence type IV pilus minor pilin ComGE [Metabacillus arenae]|uniref:Competence protein ComGE n=1 Tax=Metabacillus arenae TaxID=2771434 RepID=A0A926NC57_9BACI|nr:competence type IV pilus minor pilin ComGE [Metabacillus arenae]MBD1378834.1 hypothetical protein [Metabacillus arenae]